MSNDNLNNIAGRADAPDFLVGVKDGGPVLVPVARDSYGNPTSQSPAKWADKEGTTLVKPDATQGAAAGGPAMIVGELGVGKTLTAKPNPGWSWSGGQWGRRLPADLVLTAIANATALTYVQQTGDIGYILGYTPTNPIYRAESRAVPAPAPVITLAPVLSANAEGNQVSWAAGTATGIPSAPSISYQLFNNGRPVATTSGSYSGARAGDVLVVVMTATGIDGQQTQAMSNNVVVSAGSNDGYDIVMLAGTSNGSGRGVIDAAIDTGDANIFQFGSLSSDADTYQKIVPAIDPLKNPDSANSADRGVGPAMFFAKSMTAATGRKVLIVPVAYGGTQFVEGTMVRWSPYGTSTSSSLYREAIAQTNRAIAAAKAEFPNSRFVGVLFSPGGNDGDANTITRDKILQPLIDVVQGFRDNITGAANSWTILTQMLPETLTSRPIRKILDAVQREICSLLPRMAFVVGDLGQAKADGLHYNSVAQRAIGTRSYVTGLPSAMMRISTNAPGLVTGLGLLAAAGQNAADLSWDQLVPGGLVTDFDVQFRLSGAGSWTRLSRGQGTLALASLTGLAAGSIYEAQVRAVGPAGAGPWSASFSLTTAASSTPAPAPTPTPAPPASGTRKFVQLTAKTGSIIESGDATVGWSYGADVIVGSTSTHAGVATDKLTLGTECYLEYTLGAPFDVNYYPYLGLVTTQTDPSRTAGASGYKYSVYPSFEHSAWEMYREGGTVYQSPAIAIKPEPGDIVRLWLAVDGTVTVRVAKPADPTNFTTIYTFAAKATTDLWPAFSMGLTNTSAVVAGHRSGPLVIGIPGATSTNAVTMNGQTVTQNGQAVTYS